MSEGGVHMAVARARSSIGPTEADVRAALAGIPDPELPVVSIVELGMVHDVAVRDDRIEVAILPTFVGCPALDLIRTSIADGLRDLGRPVDVQVSYAVPWTSDRITPAGRAGLARAGIAPPTDGPAVHCPLCASGRVVMDSAFGPTQCRSLFYCRDCRQPFEAMKRV